MKNTINYFGTDLRSAGHYFWVLEGEYWSRPDLNFKDFPFDPESMPKKEKGVGYSKGDAKFYFESGWSILAIEGSCSDDRWGTKTVFFINEDLPNDELMIRIKSVAAAALVLAKLPFPINFK